MKRGQIPDFTGDSYGQRRACSPLFFVMVRPAVHVSNEGIDLQRTFYEMPECTDNLGPIRSFM